MDRDIRGVSLILCVSRPHPIIERGKIGLSSNQRSQLRVSLNGPLEVATFVIDEYSNTYLCSADIAVAFNKRSPPSEVDVKDIEQAVSSSSSTTRSSPIGSSYSHQH